MMNNELYWFWGFYIFIIGLCIGSFLNVVALRAIWEESIVFPPSKCHSCGNNLKWYHNIPVLSWLCLGGKCAFCKAPISPQYPIVELANGILYFAIYSVYGLSFNTLFLAILTSLFIVITITDIKEQVVFNYHVYPPIILGVIYNALNITNITIWESLIGIAAGFLLFEGLARIGFLFTKSRAFGEGDTIIAMGIGAYFGWKMFLLCALISVLVYGIIILPVFIKRCIENKKKETLQGLIGSFICILLLVIYNIFANSINMFLTLVFFICLMIGLIISIQKLLSDIKNKTEDELYKSEHSVPYGPGLVIATFIIMFWGNTIANFLKNFLY